MNEIRQYLITLVAAAVIAALAVNISGKSGLIPSLIKLIAGLFLTVNIVFPLIKNRFPDLSGMLSDIQIQSSQIADNGKNSAAETVTDIIKTNLEAYILDKAASMDAGLDVQIIMSDSDPPGPESVIITGNISPYQKQRLSKIINDDLGIPKEKQQWN